MDERREKKNVGAVIDRQLFILEFGRGVERTHYKAVIYLFTFFPLVFNFHR